MNKEGTHKNKLCFDLDIKCSINSNIGSSNSTQGIDSINVNYHNSTISVSVVQIVARARKRVINSNHVRHVN